MPTYNPYDAGYSADNGVETGGAYNENLRRGRYADILAQLKAPLYDPQADAQEQLKQASSMSAGVAKSMGGKYKGIVSKAPNVGLVSAIKQAGTRGKEDERKKRLAMTEEVGGDAQSENLQYDEGWMNHILRQYETDVKTKQQKDQQQASTESAGMGAIASILGLLI